MLPNYAVSGRLTISGQNTHLETNPQVWVSMVVWFTRPMTADRGRGWLPSAIRQRTLSPLPCALSESIRGKILCAGMQLRRGQTPDFRSLHTNYCIFKPLSLYGPSHFNVFYLQSWRATVTIWLRRRNVVWLGKSSRNLSAPFPVDRENWMAA